MPDWGLDEFETDAPTAAEVARAEREDVPEGDHAFGIRQVIDNGPSVEIRLEHTDRRFGWVFCRCPKEADWGRRIMSSLRKAVGMTREEWAAAPITDLVGRRVRARVYHKPKPGGVGVWANVGEFLPGAVETAAVSPVVERAVAPPSPRTRPTATQRADAAAAMPDDDIPF